MPSANVFKFTPKQEILNMNVDDIPAVCFPAKEKQVAREYLTGKKDSR